MPLVKCTSNCDWEYIVKNQHSEFGETLVKVDPLKLKTLTREADKQ